MLTLGAEVTGEPVPPYALLMMVCNGVSVPGKTGTANALADTARAAAATKVLSNFMKDSFFKQPLGVGCVQVISKHRAIQ